MRCTFTEREHAGHALAHVAPKSPSGGWGNVGTQQVVGKDVPEDGEEQEGAVGKQHHPPAALVPKALLIAAQDGQAHTDPYHCTSQVRHEAGLWA